MVDATHAVPAHQRQISFGLPAKHAARHERIAELMDSVALDASMMPASPRFSSPSIQVKRCHLPTRWR